MAETRTAAEMVTLIQSAIEAIVVRGAASYSIDGRVFTALDLDKLRTLLGYYTSLANETETGTGPVMTHGVVF